MRGEIMESLSERLRTARERACLSPAQASELTGINYKTLNNYEHSVSKPGIHKLSAICKAYHVSADYFIQPEIDEMKESAPLLKTRVENSNDIEENLMKKYRRLSPDGKKAADENIDTLLKLEQAILTEPDNVIY
jgi:transcriptional regulator with XRE-family HTH domain